VVDELVVERDRSRTPLFQVLFTHVERAGQSPSGEETGFGDVGVRRERTLYDLTVTFMESAGGELSAAIEYSLDLFERATVHRLGGHLPPVLAAVAADPDRALSRLPLLTAAEQAELSAWASAPRVEPFPRPVPELIASRVAETPDTVAVVSGPDRLS